MAEKKSQFDQRKYIREYQKEHLTRVAVVLSKERDRDIIEHLARKNKSQYIKALIRKDMKADAKH